MQHKRKWRGQASLNLGRGIWQDIDVDEPFEADNELEAARLFLNYVKENWAWDKERKIRVYPIFEASPFAKVDRFPNLEWTDELLTKWQEAAKRIEEEVTVERREL